MRNDTLSFSLQSHPKLAANPIKPLHQVQKILPKPTVSHKPYPSKQPQVPKFSRSYQSSGTTTNATQWWIPKTLLQAQGYYQGKTSIWVPKQRQGQVKQHQP